MLAWAADAGEAVFSGGLVLAAVALVGVLPEFIIEVRFAFIQQAELVTANLTGRHAAPAHVRRRAAAAGGVHRPSHGGRRRRADPARRRRAGSSSASCWSPRVFAIQIVVRGSLTVFDGVILLALYVVYARRVQGTPDEEPAVVGVAAGLLSLPAALSPTGRRRGLIVGAGSRRRR